MAIQRGAPLREEAGWGGEDPEEVPRQSPCHCGEEPQGQDWGPGQEEVPSSLRSHSRSVLLPHPEEDQPQAGGCSLLLRQQRDSSYLCHYGLPVPGNVILSLCCSHNIMRNFLSRVGLVTAHPTLQLQSPALTLTLLLSHQRCCVRLSVPVSLASHIGFFYWTKIDILKLVIAPCRVGYPHHLCHLGLSVPSFFLSQFKYLCKKASVTITFLIIEVQQKLVCNISAGPQFPCWLWLIIILYIYCPNILLFQEHHEEDFFLYIAYSDESVYGN